MAFALFMVGACGPQPKAAISMIHGKPLADPYVFREGCEWFIYGTQDYYLHGPRLAKGALKESKLKLVYGKRKPPAGVWGFHPFKAGDGQWHGVATLHLGYFKTEIAAFDPAPGEQWPVKRWVFKRVLVPYVEGKMATYETKVYTDTDGTEYLVYCRSLGLGKNVSIMMHRMSAPDQLDPNSEPVVLLQPDGYESEHRNEGLPLQIVEGPNIVARGGMFLLLYTVGDFANPNYKAGFAYSRTLVPKKGETYKKLLIEDPKGVWGGKTDQEVRYLVQSLKPDWPNYVKKQVVGPGLLNLVTEDGKDYLVFHGYVPGTKRLDGGRRMLWKMEVKVDVNPGRDPSTWIVPVEQWRSSQPSVFSSGTEN